MNEWLPVQLHHKHEKKKKKKKKNLGVTSALLFNFFLLYFKIDGEKNSHTN
jgi:hypothetical protein